MKIGIIGYGVVGSALGRWIQRNTKHTVHIYDPGKGEVEDLPTDVAAVFVAVPVPTKVDRTQDLSILGEAIERVNTYDVPVFVRSTVLPGTCDALSQKYGVDVHACPEFLTERQADMDMARHPIVVGSGSYESQQRIEALLPQILPGKGFFLRMTNVEAETAKYAHNAFAAVKVGFFNTIFELCKRTGANYQAVLSMASVTGFIGAQTHTSVPGHDGKMGFGGKCLPKDLAALVGFARELELPFATLLGTEIENSSRRDDVEKWQFTPRTKV
jgi:nucleotide sugar dehydrogenase